MQAFDHAWWECFTNDRGLETSVQNAAREEKESKCACARAHDTPAWFLVETAFSWEGALCEAPLNQGGGTFTRRDGTFH